MQKRNYLGISESETKVVHGLLGLIVPKPGFLDFKNLFAFLVKKNKTKY